MVVPTVLAIMARRKCARWSSSERLRPEISAEIIETPPESWTLGQVPAFGLPPRRGSGRLDEPGDPSRSYSRRGRFAAEDIGQVADPDGLFSSRSSLTAAPRLATLPKIA